MNILVLFAGAGLATRGLINAGHFCVDVEYQASKHYLSQNLNPEASHLLGDVRDLTDDFIYSFDAIWASPPCQFWSARRNFEASIKDTTGDLLLWTLDKYINRPNKNQVWWIENVVPGGLAKRDAQTYLTKYAELLTFGNSWQYGKLWNAVQFLEKPIQTRRRIIAGNYEDPASFRQFQYSYPLLKLAPCLKASFYGSKPEPDKKKNGRFVKCPTTTYYGRKLTLEDAAYLQGVQTPFPDAWFVPLLGYSQKQWEYQIGEGLGNGVPVYMAEAFGKVYQDLNTYDY